MTLRQLMENADRDELCLWIAMHKQEAAEQKKEHDKHALIAKAEAALSRR